MPPRAVLQGEVSAHTFRVCKDSPANWKRFCSVPLLCLHWRKRPVIMGCNEKCCCRHASRHRHKNAANVQRLNGLPILFGKVHHDTSYKCTGLDSACHVPKYGICGRGNVQRRKGVRRRDIGGNHFSQNSCVWRIKYDENKCLREHAAREKRPLKETFCTKHVLTFCLVFLVTGSFVAVPESNGTHTTISLNTHRQELLPRVACHSMMHALVPSSNAPPKREWTVHYWYVLFAGALQARKDLPDDQAERLVNWVKAFDVALCCDDCKLHYRAAFDDHPFTVREARDPVAATQWLVRLRRSIERRLDAATAAASSKTPQTQAMPSEPGGWATRLTTGTARFLPAFPGKVWASQDARREEHDALDAALAAALEASATNRANGTCACSGNPVPPPPPTWGTDPSRASLFGSTTPASTPSARPSSVSNRSLQRLSKRQ